jgi:hypothetical protein
MIPFAKRPPTAGAIQAIPGNCTVPPDEGAFDDVNWGWCVTWSDVENQGLVLFLCALDVEDHFKGDSGASGFRSASGDAGDPKHVPYAELGIREIMPSH